jgi:hypothetical protein
MQHRLKLPPGAARTWVVSSELFNQFLVAVHNPVSALYTRFAQGTPDDACSCAQKEWSESKFFDLFLAIRPSCSADSEANKKARTCLPNAQVTALS